MPTESIRAAWAGISDTIGGLIDGATARVANAWNKVKSVFTFSGGDTEANISVTDPATIQAAQMATAALKTDMQAVAAIDTAPAMSLQHSKHPHSKSARQSCHLFDRLKPS